jgi:uncharacterized protein YhfF
MSKTDAVQKFWEEFCKSNPEINPAEPFQVWFFSNSRESARELAELVISEKKKATASLVSINEMKPEIAPIPDGYSVVTDFDGNPLCVIQTTEIRHLPFDEVDAQFAFDEGEGDRTLEDWRDGHWRYFTREAAESAVEFDEKSLICCERFNLLFPKI